MEVTLVDTIERETAVASLPDFRDDDDGVNPAFLEAVAEAIASGDAARCLALAGDLHEADVGQLIERLDAEDRPRLIALMGRQFDFTALTEVDDAVREEILDELPNEAIAEGVRDLDSDDAVYILEDLDKEDKDEVLARLPESDRESLNKSLDYPDDTAGRRMQTEFIAVPTDWNVGQAIDYMRETADLPDRFYQLHVVDSGRRLAGSVPLDRLLRTKRPVAIAAIMEEPEHTVGVTEGLDEPQRLFRDYNLVSIPVLDDGGRLVGVLTFDDIVDILDEGADADIKALGGVMAGEEISDTVWTILKSRFTWLFVNLLTAILAASVIAQFEKALEKMVALAVLMPIVASMGGNAGTQSLTVAVRALATRELDRDNAMRVVRREVTVGILNGIAFALVMGAVAVIWFGPLAIGPVIGLAIIVTLAAAALGGVVIPVALDRLGIDPAISSGPLVTTITDVVGFFAFLGIASFWFGLR
jgi:magnesium transporter